MPILSVVRDALLEALGRSFTQEQFEQLCFDFGIELDDVTSESEIVAKMKGIQAAKGLSTEIIYKIDIPANRYDLLCLEGLSRALKVFLSLEDPPTYMANGPATIVMQVSAATAQIRPIVVCAVLRGVTFTSQSYQSFLDLQDKLHQNIGRERSLVAIGTHDLDTVEPPFRYDALPGSEFRFQALKEDRDMSCSELFDHYRNKTQCEVKKFLPLVETSPVFPVVFDASGRVLSAPPIINSEHSKITLDTTNVLIECTATDKTKAHIVLNTMVCMFSQYTSPRSFVCDPVEVRYPDGSTEITPDLSLVYMETSSTYINRGIGTDINVKEMVRLLHRMQINASLIDDDRFSVAIPPTRSDILHPCDILEDVAIAFGYNNINKTMPACYTMAKPNAIGSLSDQIREGVAQAGFCEVLTWALVSRLETYKNMLQPDLDDAVTVANPKTAEFQMVRTSLLPGILKTLAYNRASQQLPIKLFELSDVAVCDERNVVGARNERRLGAMYCARSAGFDIIHGLLDRVMTLNNVRYNDKSAADFSKGQAPAGQYCIRQSTNPSFLPNLRADIIFQPGNSEEMVCLGSMGILHPQILLNFGVDSPCSALEMTIEPLLDAGRNMGLAGAGQS